MPTIERIGLAEYNTNQRKEAIDNSIRILNKLCNVLDVDQPLETSVAEMSAVIDETPHRVTTLIRILQNIRVLQINLGPRQQKTGRGLSSYWRLLVPCETAEKKLLDTISATSLEKAKVRGVRHTKGEPTVAYTTAQKSDPSPINAFSDLKRVYGEPKALVEATRQYVNQRGIADEHLRALKSAGLKINDETYYSSIDLKKDERLENIALILPYIDEMCQTIERLERDNRKLSMTTPSVQQYKDTITTLENKNRILREALKSADTEMKPMAEEIKEEEEETANA